MIVSKKHADLQEIISYTSPQLYTGKEWFVGFMAFDPAQGKLHRKKIKLNRIPGITARRRYANDLIIRLNEELKMGWNPWIEAENATLTAAILHRPGIIIWLRYDCFQLFW